MTFPSLTNTGGGHEINKITFENDGLSASPDLRRNLPRSLDLTYSGRESQLLLEFCAGLDKIQTFFLFLLLLL